MLLQELEANSVHNFITFYQETIKHFDGELNWKTSNREESHEPLRCVHVGL